MKFRTKPAEVDAWPIHALHAMYVNKDFDQLPDAVFDAYGAGVVEFTDTGIQVAALDGIMTAPLGYWLVIGPDDDFTVSEPAKFAQRYEAVDLAPEHMNEDLPHIPKTPYDFAPEA